MQYPPSDSTPAVDLGFDTGRGHIKGRCATGRVEPLFTQIINEMNAGLADFQLTSYELAIDLDEVPSTVIPYLRQIFDHLQSWQKKGLKIVVLYHYPSPSQRQEQFAQTLQDRYHGLVTAQSRPDR